ncbi:MAG: hypothetical protein RL375_3335 [Pseudomonadota bacterium]
MINDQVADQSQEFSGYYDKPRLSLLALLSGHAPSHVLEIGCGGAANLLEMKRRHPACRTVGVDIRPEVAPLARSRVDAFHLGDIFAPKMSDSLGRDFDVVILSHVLEHFPQPERVLALVRGLMRPGGELLVALPNVRHLSVVLDLVVSGDFRYTSSGILDHTHMRFFTRKSAERFLCAQGLHIDQIAADIEGPRSRLLDRLTLGAAREFAAFAYNFRLTLR